jgi:hypothetical protein
LWIPVHFSERPVVAASGPGRSLAGASRIPRVLPAGVTSRPSRRGDASEHDKHLPGRQLG